MTITVQPASHDDLPTLKSFDEWKVVTAERVDAGHLFIAADEQQPRAMGILDRSFMNRAFVSILFVHPDHRHRGLGEALLGHFEDVTIDKQLWISTNIENLAMQRMLQKRDYELSGVVNQLGKLPELFYFKIVGASPTS